MAKAQKGKNKAAKQEPVKVRPFDHMHRFADELRLTYQELETQTDRGMAIIGGVAIEARLESLIKTVLVPGKKLPGTGTAYGKRETAFALGLISDAERTEIGNLFEVRNKFAHNLTAISFEAPEVRPLCDRLTFAKQFYLNHKWTDFLTERYHDGTWNLEEPLILPRDYVIYPYDEDPRKRYEWTVLALIEILSVRTRADLRRIPNVPADLESMDDIEALRWSGSAITLAGIRERIGGDFADELSKGRDYLMTFNTFYRASVIASLRHYEQENAQSQKQSTEQGKPGAER